MLVDETRDATSLQSRVLKRVDGGKERLGPAITKETVKLKKAST